MIVDFFELEGLILKVLLLSIKAGYGHHSTAKAIMEQFEAIGHECEMLDIFEYINHYLCSSVQNGYLFSTKYCRGIYEKSYTKLTKREDPYGRHAIPVVFSRFVAKKIGDYVKDYNADIIISTHSYAALCVTQLINDGIIKCPTIGIVTDFTVHPFGESSKLDYYVIPDELMNEEMMSKGIRREQLLPFGIPVKSQFKTKIDKQKARERLGIYDMTTVLVMMGSMGYGNIKKILSDLDNFRYDFQVLCICGSNKRIKKAVDSYRWIKPVFSYGFVDNVDVMMDASDFIISKPGGLTTSEALAKGLPMIAMQPIPGHERRNLEFLTNNGVAVGVDDSCSLSQALEIMLKNPERINSIQNNVKIIGKPNATVDLYNFACEKVSEKLTLI